MLDAGARELGRDPVQRDRVGRGQAAVARRVRGLQPERAQAGRPVAQAGPELAGEHRDRALAAGAGDGHDRRGCRPKNRAATRARAARGSSATRAGRSVAATVRCVAQHRHGPGGPRVGAGTGRRRCACPASPRTGRRRGPRASRGLGRRSRPRRCPAGGGGHRTALPGARLASRRVSFACLRMQLGQPRPILLRHLGRRWAERPGSARSGR